MYLSFSSNPVLITHLIAAACNCICGYLLVCYHGLCFYNNNLGSVRCTHALRHLMIWSNTTSGLMTFFLNCWELFVSLFGCILYTSNWIYIRLHWRYLKNNWKNRLGFINSWFLEFFNYFRWDDHYPKWESGATTHHIMWFTWHPPASSLAYRSDTDYNK